MTWEISSSAISPGSPLSLLSGTAIVTSGEDVFWETIDWYCGFKDGCRSAGFAIYNACLSFDACAFAKQDADIELFNCLSRQHLLAVQWMEGLKVAP